MLADDELRGLLTTRLPELRPDVEAELAAVLGRAQSRARRRRAAYAAGMVAAVLALVVVLNHDWRTSAQRQDPVDPSPVRHLVNRGVYSDPAGLEPGQYVAQLLGTRHFPGVRVSLDIPAGWGQDGWVAIATGPGDDDRTRRIDLFANVQRLIRDGCPRGDVAVDPGAKAFADALAALDSPATAAEPASLGGHTAYRVRMHRAPGVTSGACRGDLVLREDLAGVIRTRAVPGWTSLTWVTEVEDTVVVVAASHGPDVTPAEEEELVEVVESLTFVLP